MSEQKSTEQKSTILTNLLILPQHQENEENEEYSSSEDDYDYNLLFGLLPIPEPTSDTPGIPIKAECVICKENLINTLTRPCNHASMCVGCARNYSKNKRICPVCRTSLIAIERLYLSFTRYNPNNVQQPCKKRKFSSL